LTSNASSQSPSSAISVENAAIAAAIAVVSQGWPPRIPASTSAKRSREIDHAAAAMVTGGSSTLRSEKNSASTPPGPVTMSGPRAGSRAIPTISSGPGGTSWQTATRGPSRAARSA
jgi:hypothetical protein